MTRCASAQVRPQSMGSFASFLVGKFGLDSVALPSVLRVLQRGVWRVVSDDTTPSSVSQLLSEHRRSDLRARVALAGAPVAGVHRQARPRHSHRDPAASIVRRSN
jgi:hypothetical protein